MIKAGNARPLFLMHCLCSGLCKCYGNFISKNTLQLLSIFTHSKMLKCVFYGTFSMLSLDRTAEICLPLLIPVPPRAWSVFFCGFHSMRLDKIVPDYSDNCSDNCWDYSDNLKKEKKKKKREKVGGSNSGCFHLSLRGELREKWVKSQKTLNEADTEPVQWERNKQNIIRPQESIRKRTFSTTLFKSVLETKNSFSYTNYQIILHAG